MEEQHKECRVCGRMVNPPCGHHTPAEVEEAIEREIQRRTAKARKKEGEA